MTLTWLSSFLHAPAEFCVGCAIPQLTATSLRTAEPNLDQAGTFSCNKSRSGSQIIYQEHSNQPAEILQGTFIETPDMSFQKDYFYLESRHPS